MIFGIADNRDLSAAGFHFFAFRHARDGVVRALRLEVRTNLPNDRAHIFLAKDDDRIDIRKCGKNLSAFFSWHHGTTRAFQRAHRTVAIDRDYELVCERPRGVKIANVADMQHVEAAIREGDALA